MKKVCYYSIKYAIFKTNQSQETPNKEYEIDEKINLNVVETLPFVKIQINLILYLQLAYDIRY